MGDFMPKIENQMGDIMPKTENQMGNFMPKMGDLASQIGALYIAQRGRFLLQNGNFPRCVEQVDDKGGSKYSIPWKIRSFLENGKSLSFPWKY